MSNVYNGYRPPHAPGAKTGENRRTTSREPYSEGNGSWNTDRYNSSVRTERTSTRVLNAGASRYYYDNTPAAVRARQKKEFERRRAKWKEAARKNKRLKKFKRAVTSAVITIATVAVAVTLVYKLFFVTKNITVEGSSRYTAEEIISSCNLTDRTNLFSFSSREAGEMIRFKCPYVSESVFDRTAPDKLNIAVTEEEALFCVDIYGEVFTLSDSLRVLERINVSDGGADGLIKLRISGVSRAVAGDKIRLSSQRAQRFLENTAELLNSSELKGRITMIDLRNDFDIVMAADNMYRLEFGTQDYLDVKLRLAASVLKDELFNSGNKAYIDLRDTAKTSVIIDNQLVFD